MGIISYIRGLFGYGNDLDALVEALTVAPKGVEVYGVISDARLDTLGGETAVFEVELRERESGKAYGETRVEFAVPDEGLEGDSELRAFLTSHGVTDPSELGSILGVSVNVENVSGNWEVQW